MTGTIRASVDPGSERAGSPVPTKLDDQELSRQDVYKELRLRGYHYSELFASVTSSNREGSRGRIAWKHNWVAFMDNMLQMKILGGDTRGLFVPTGIQKIVIDTKLMYEKSLIDENQG